MARAVLIFLEILVVGLGAMAGGFRLGTDPSGESMGLPVSLLENSPFSSYLVPGIFLFWVIGCGNILAGILAWKKWDGFIPLSRFSGAILVVWIGLQIYWLGWPPYILQLIYGGVGILIVGLATWLDPGRRKW